MVGKEKISERKEAVMRILIGIVSGIVFYIWWYLTLAVIVIQIIYSLFADKRHKGMAEFNDMFSSAFYQFLSYLSGNTNRRPFPFYSFDRLGKFEK